MKRFQRISIRIVTAALIVILLAAGCGSGSGTAESPTTTEHTKGGSPGALGAPPVESLDDWKRRGDAIIVATVTQSTRVPVDEPAPHRLYADQLDITINKALWTYPPRKGDLASSAKPIRLYGQSWTKTGSGDMVPTAGDGPGGKTPPFEVGDQFVASVTFAPESAKSNWDVYLTGPSTAIPVVAGKLKPTQDAPSYQSELAGDPVGEFASKVKSIPEGDHVDPWTGAGTPTTAGR